MISKSSSGSSDSGSERSVSISIDLKHIKITPDYLERELSHQPAERRTIQQLTEELREFLWTKTKEIQERAPALEPGYRILYRVHGDLNGEPDLKSAAEQSGQHLLSAEQKSSLVHIHAERNKRSVKEPLCIYNFKHQIFLVSCTFYLGTAGDPNL